MFFLSSDKLLMNMFWPNFIGAAEDFDSCSCSCCQATERTVQEQERSEDGLPPGFKKKRRLRWETLVAGAGCCMMVPGSGKD